MNSKNIIWQVLLEEHPSLWQYLSQGWTIKSWTPRNTLLGFYEVLLHSLCPHFLEENKIIYFDDKAVHLCKYLAPRYVLQCKYPGMSKWRDIGNISFSLEILQEELKANLQHTYTDYRYRIMQVGINNDLVKNIQEIILLPSGYAYQQPDHYKSKP